MPIKNARAFPQAQPLPSISRTPDAAPCRVLHAIGELTESVLRFLIPAAAAVHRSGLRQHVLVLKDGGRREVLERRLPPGTTVTVASQGAGILRRSGEWRGALRDIEAAGSLDVAHLHGATALGLLAAVGGIRAARRLVYSPQGAWDRRTSARWRSKAPELLMSPILKLPNALVISSHDRSDRGAVELSTDGLAWVCPPLAPALQLTQPPTAEPSLVLAAAAGKSRRAAMAFTQLGVLAAQGTVGAPVFQWSGNCDASAAPILTAAGVRIHRDDEPSACAARLSRATAFVSPGPDDRYPWHIAEAMACGVPVVALDTPNNRRLVIDGVTGYLCRSVEDMLAPLMTLIKRQELRQRLGNAARVRALDEFGSEAFTRRLMDAYGLIPAVPHGTAEEPDAAQQALRGTLAGE